MTTGRELSTHSRVLRNATCSLKLISELTPSFYNPVMHESMLNTFRRRLVVLTIVAAVFLLLTFHWIYTGTGTETGSAVADRLPSFIHGLLTGAHAIGALQNASRTSVEYGTFPLLCLSLKLILLCVQSNNVNVQPTVRLPEPARTSETSRKSPTVPQPVPPPKVLIVARTEPENTDWIQSYLPE
jgi:hypothetical protein